MFINSLLEFITIGSMIPFITFVSNPDKILEIQILQNFSNFFNIQRTEDLFLLVSFLLIIVIFSSGFIKILNVKLINDFSAILKIELGEKLYTKILYQEYYYHLNTNSSHLISSQINHLDSAISLISELMNHSIEIVSEEKRKRPLNSEVNRLFGSNKKIFTLTDWSLDYGGIEGFKKGLKITIDWFAISKNLSIYKSDYIV